MLLWSPLSWDVEWWDDRTWETRGFYSLLLLNMQASPWQRAASESVMFSTTCIDNLAFHKNGLCMLSSQYLIIAQLMVVYWTCHHHIPQLLLLLVQSMILAVSTCSMNGVVTPLRCHHHHHLQQTFHLEPLTDSNVATSSSPLVLHLENPSLPQPQPCGQVNTCWTLDTAVSRCHQGHTEASLHAGPPSPTIVAVGAHAASFCLVPRARELQVLPWDLMWTLAIQGAVTLSASIAGILPHCRITSRLDPEAQTLLHCPMFAKFVEVAGAPLPSGEPQQRILSRRTFARVYQIDCHGM